LPCVGVIVIFVLGSVIFSVLVINITPIKVNGLNVVSYKGYCWILLQSGATTAGTNCLIYFNFKKKESAHFLRDTVFIYYPKLTLTRFCLWGLPRFLTE
jgi:hypothetical protein